MSPLFKGLFFILFYFIIFSNAYKQKFKLELLQVIFRHGDRTPQANEVYEKDPYNPKYYETLGYGQLTEAGLYRSYKFGQVLRQRYNKFLGEYRFNKVFGYSTDKDRTKVSLQAVLAGLYAPKPNGLCNNKTISLAPVPTSYDVTERNFLVRNVWGFCPRYLELKEENEKTSEIKKRLKKYAGFFKYLEKVTGLEIKDLEGPVGLYNNMISLMSMNLTRPAWCTQTVLEKLHDIVEIVYDAKALTERLKRIMLGPTIERFLENIKNNTEKVDDGRKIYLYSAHDVILGALTRAHNFTNIPGVPDFSSALLIEKLRGLDDQVYLRMFYWTGVTERMIPLTFEDVGYEIPLDTYQKKVHSLLPRADDCI